MKITEVFFIQVLNYTQKYYHRIETNVLYRAVSFIQNVLYKRSHCSTVNWQLVKYCILYTRRLTFRIYSDIQWEDSSVYKRYIVSLYWTVTTVTSVGYESH